MSNTTMLNDIIEAHQQHTNSTEANTSTTIDSSFSSMLEGRKIHSSLERFTNIVNKTNKAVMTKSMMNNIMMKMKQTTVIVALKTANSIARNITIPNKVHQIMKHHTVPIVKLATKSIDLGSGKESSSTQDTTVLPFTD